jgi:hypothetical protein
MHGVSWRRSFCVTTERDVRRRPTPDLVNRAFVATDIKPLWVADMTYIPTWIPTACFAPVDKTPQGLIEGPSPCPQASAVDKPAPFMINQGSGSQNSQTQEA